MADANYRIKVRRDVNGSPLLIVTFDVQYEVLLNQDRFQNLTKSVVKYSDGVEGEKLTQEEFLLWGDELQRMLEFKNSMSELRPYAMMELETKPSSIPRGLLHQILTHYEENTTKPIHIFITGKSPNLNLNFNCGTITYSASISASQVPETRKTLGQLSEEAQRCVDLGKTKDEVVKSLKDIGEASIRVGKVNKEVIECVVTLPGLAAGAAAAKVAVDQCKEWLDSIQELNDAYSKEQEEKDRAAREQHHLDTEAAIERALKCADVYGEGIEKARDFDQAMERGSIG
ncbi:hypothetical protein [Pseudomonas sp. S1(2024)]|uniref:hypothetical protein n=1 Tax=Pseudomonas sp. S1(2024) TaxID=3390191 RepID=UPI00397A5AA3